MIAGEERGGNGDLRSLLEAADGARFVGKNFEDGEQLCDLQKVMHFFCKVQEFQFPAIATDGGVSADEFADSGTVDVIHIGKIQHDFAMRIVDELANRFAEHGAAVAERDATAGVHYGDGAGIARSEVEGHCSGFLMRRRTAAAVRLRCAVGRKALGHDDFRAASAGGHNVKFVHESAHKKNPAAGSAQKIFFGERIGNVGEFEAGAFVGDVNDHFFGREIDGEMNFLVGLFFVAVMKGVDDAFADTHADAIALVFAKAGGFGESEAHFFGQVDTFDLGFERDF